MDTDPRPSPLALAVLGLLMAGPLHPYGMQRLLRQWGKDRVINVGQRASLYKTIKRLQAARLIEVSQTERDQQYPERTVYMLTAEGDRTAREWLDDMIAIPRNEFPQFPAALSFAMLLPPERARAALERRAAALRATVEQLEQDLARHSGALPRITLLDDEYLGAVTAAELRWVSGLLDDLRSGALTWSKDDLASVAEQDLTAFAPADLGAADFRPRG